MRIRGLLAVLLCAAVTACHESAELAPAGGNRPIRVEVAAVRRGEIADVLDVPGETAALSVLRLASPVAGRVTYLGVHAGDPLARGDVAARVIPLENEAALHGLRLLERAGGLSPSEQKRALSLGRGLGTQDIALRVPFAAVVSDRLRNPGEQVAQNDVLLELFDPKSLYVLAQVPIAESAQLRVGMPVQVRDGMIGATGTIAALVSSVVPQSLTLPVRVVLTTPLQPPLLHAAVQCRIALVRHTGALLIPRSALVSSQVKEQGTVMVAVKEQARLRQVRLGLRTKDTVEVTEGLREGEQVLVQGQYGLPDGTPITPVSAPNGPAA
jgi:HlyD family secretion protein